MLKPIRLLIIGAGDRGSIYASYAHKYPDQFVISAIAEKNIDRRDRIANLWDLPQEYRFNDWRDALKQRDLADVAVITVTDELHLDVASYALDQGYDLLLEKPIACSIEDCITLERKVRETKRRVILGYVLRYSDYYSQIKTLLNAKAIGDIVSLCHVEAAGHIQGSHSYCRGNWSNIDQSCAMIVQKCCHDFDQIVWWLNKPCEAVSSFGGLNHFTAENRPKGASDRCITCPDTIERNCPYSAIRLYQERGNLHYALLDSSPKGIQEELRTGRYGRCVYACDNNAVDHQIVNMRFQGNISAVLLMETYSYNQERSTRIFGTKGEIICDQYSITVKDFITRTTTVWNSQEESKQRNGAESRHGGGDYGLMRELYRAYNHDTAEQWAHRFSLAMESHFIAFAAAESQTQHGVLVTLDADRPYLHE